MQGFDISHHNGRVNFQRLKPRAGFVYIKATEGRAGIDPKFDHNWRQAKAAGIPRGCYHFFHPELDAIAQARNFVEVFAADYEPADLLPVCDVEIDRGVSPQNIARGLGVFLTEVEAALKVRPVIYTSPGFWRGQMLDTTAFRDYPLWVAHYTSKPAPYKFGGWAHYLLWQFTQTGTAPGIVGNVDENRLNPFYDLSILRAGGVVNVAL